MNHSTTTGNDVFVVTHGLVSDVILEIHKPLPENRSPSLPKKLFIIPRRTPSKNFKEIHMLIFSKQTDGQTNKQTDATRKALTRGRTDHSVTYLQFLIQVYFSADCARAFVSTHITCVHSRKRFPPRIYAVTLNSDL